MADETDGSGSLELVNMDDESCGSSSSRGVTELFTMEKWSGITFASKRKIPVTLNPELPCDIGAVLAQPFPLSSATWYRGVLISLWFLIHIIVIGLKGIEERKMH
jgi:hypothetical protein